MVCMVALSNQIVTDDSVGHRRTLAHARVKDHVVLAQVGVERKRSGDGSEHDITLEGDDHFVARDLKGLTLREELRLDFLHEVRDLGIVRMRLAHDSPQ